MKPFAPYCRFRFSLTLFLAAFFGAGIAVCQENDPTPLPPSAPGEIRGSTDDYNQRVQLLAKNLAGTSGNNAGDYRIGPEDLLKISVFEAPDLNQTVRVSASGSIALPSLGSVVVAGRTTRELELLLEDLFRQTYLKDPHVGVFVEEMQSHSVSVFGAVDKPGVFQIRGPKTLIEVLSLAQGLATDAGDTVTVLRSAGTEPLSAEDSPVPDSAASPQKEPSITDPSPSSPGDAARSGGIKIKLKDLLESDHSQNNILVFPGDSVIVSRAGIVYVVGSVKKPGGFVLNTNENISVLQALALAEGPTTTSAKSRARIIRAANGAQPRAEIPINLARILAGKAEDPILHPKDILFVPNSSGKSALFRGIDAAVGMGTGVVIYGVRP